MLHNDEAHSNLDIHVKETGMKRYFQIKKDRAQRRPELPTSRPNFEEELMLRCLLTMHDICLSQPGQPTTCGWATCGRTFPVRWAARRDCQFCQPPLHCRTFARYVAGGQAGGSPKHAWPHTCAQRRRWQASMLSQVSRSACLLYGGGCPPSCERPGSSEITTSFFRPLEEPLQIGPDQTRLGSQRPWLDWMEGGQFPGIGDAAQCS